jgi:hypothetical protein
MILLGCPSRPLPGGLFQKKGQNWRHNPIALFRWSLSGG